MDGAPDDPRAWLVTAANPRYLDALHRLPALRAHLLEQADDPAGALAEYRRAHGLATNLAERRHLAAQVARLERR